MPELWWSLLRLLLLQLQLLELRPFVATRELLPAETLSKDRAGLALPPYLTALELRRLVSPKLFSPSPWPPRSALLCLLTPPRSPK